MKLAAIDIGSNAARLLISEVIDGTKGEPEFVKLNLLRIPLRLGMDVFTKGEIGPEREKMVIDSMKVFADLMRIYKVEHYRAAATSAMRDARNGEEIIKEVRNTSGINIEIISGDEEASLIYENHIAENMDKNYDYLYVDVGGGSTELTYYKDGKMEYEHSFNIGTIRLLNGLVTDDHWKEMKEAIKNNIESKNKLVAIGSGGNINKVFSMSKTKDKDPISDVTIRQFYNDLSELTVEERMTKHGFRQDRADVIVPALEIVKNVLSWAGIHKMYVPKISVADGLIHNIYNNLQEKNK